MKKALLSSKRRPPFLSLLCVALCISLACMGCTADLFGVSEDSEPSSLSALLDSASTVADYENIINLSEAIIDAPNSTASEIGEANAFLGEAILGVQGIDPISVLENLSQLGDMGQDSTSSDSANLFDLIDFGNANTTQLKNAAEAFNTASANITLSDSQQLNQGISNMMYIINAVQDHYDVGNDGVLTNLDNTETDATILSQLVGTGEDDYDISSFANNAQAAFNGSESLSSNQLAQVGAVVTVSDDLTSLNTAYANGGTFNTYSFSGSQNATDDAKLEDALNDIFGAISET